MGVTYEVRANKAFYNKRTIKEWIDTAINDIVTALDPVQIYIFGSVARGDDGPDSDLDILVVFDQIRDDQLLDFIIEARRSNTAPIPRDVLVTDLARFAFNKLRPWHIEHQIAKEGLLMYERTPKIEKEEYMNPPQPDEIKDAEDLLNRAKDDLISSDLLNNRVGKPNVCFHAQQAAEKALKVLFITEKSEIPKTHDLVDLVEKLPNRYISLFDKQALDSLSWWAVGGRYLADMPDVANKPTDFLIDTAKSVVDTVANLVQDIRIEREQSRSLDTGQS